MKRYNIELNKSDAILFKAFLKGLNASYETSSCYNLIHFELNLTENQVTEINNFLELL